ncbi:MAG: hypothetical protein CV081_12895 [Nitrospira sp. LK265]|nr:hypothetical protein [Nitrospira sp. LK265]
MLLTVAVCTWNRSRLLRQCLEQMTKLDIPVGVEWELLVVNNNCTDDTDHVVDSFVSRLPVRLLFEAKPGQSNARNAAVREAKGQYVLWTDDDVLVDENWIANYAKAFQRWPEAVVFGGPITPWFVETPPTWLEQVWPRVADAYAIRDLGPEPVKFDGRKRTPYGANFVVRTKEQHRNLYDARLGLRPGSSIRGEEIDLVNKLLTEGNAGWWVPGASVRHYVPPERMTTRYLRDYYLGYGQYLAMKEPAWDGPTILGKPRWLWRQIITAELKYRFHRLTSPPEVWIRELIDARVSFGRFVRMK